MDNRYYKYNCPPIMNDGRFISSYVRSRVFDQYIRSSNNVDSAQNYRHFLQNNADQIINNTKAYLRENNICKIEGKCLPVSIPSGTTENYIKSNNEKYDFFYQIDLPAEDIIHHTKNTSENLSDQHVQELNKKRWANNVYKHRQQSYN